MHHHARRAGFIVLLLSLLPIAGSTAHAQTTRSASSSDAERAAGYVAHGRRYWRARRYTESAGAYRRATRLTPRDPRAFAGLARAYAALGAHRAAVSAYRRAITLVASVPASLHNAVARSLTALGDREGASAAYRTALQSDPANVEARTGYETLHPRAAVVAPGPPVIRNPGALRTIEAPPANRGVPLLAGGFPLAIVGLVAGAGCAIAYAMEPSGVSGGPAGSEPLTWVGCIGSGAVLMGVGIALIGVGVSQGVGEPDPARAAGDVDFHVAPTRAGATASVRVTF